MRTLSITSFLISSIIIIFSSKQNDIKEPMVSLEIASIENDTCIQNTFLKMYSSPLVELGDAGLYYLNDKIYVTGSAQDEMLLMEVSLEGEIIQTINFKYTSNPKSRITSLAFDGVNLLIGGEERDNTNIGSVTKMNPDDFSIIWSKSISPNASVRTINVVPNTDTFIVNSSRLNANAPGSNTDATLLKMDGNGSVSPDLFQNYSLNGTEDFIDQIMVNNFLYSVGSLNLGSSSPADIRQGITKMDLQGNVIWNKIGPIPISQTARLYGRSIINHDGALYSVFTGSKTTASVSSNTNFWIEKNDYDGNLNWRREYNIDDNDGEWAEQIIYHENGFVIAGHFRNGDEDVFLMKIDLEGNIIWTNRYKVSERQTLSQSQNKMFVIDENIYFTCSVVDGISAYEIALFKTDENGLISESCVFITPLAATMTDFSTLQNLDVILTQYPGDQNVETALKNMTPFNILERNLCVEAQTTNVIVPDTLKACLGDSLFLSIEDYPEIDWNGNYELNCDTCTDIAFMASNNGLLNVCVTNFSGCSFLDTVLICVKQPASTTLERRICEGDSIFYNEEYYFVGDTYSDTMTSANSCDSIVLTQIISANENIEVQSENGTTGGRILISDFDPSWQVFLNEELIFTNGTIENLLAGEYSLRIEFIPGCFIEQAFDFEAFIPCDQRIFMPNLFSPNGDGLNESFMVFGQEYIETFESMIIFDRWGDLVFKCTDMNCSWDGNVNSTPAPSGVYVYLISFGCGGNNYVEKGNITLLR